MGSPTPAAGTPESPLVFALNFIQQIPPNLLFTAIIGLFFISILTVRPTFLLKAVPSIH